MSGLLRGILRFAFVSFAVVAAVGGARAASTPAASDGTVAIEAQRLAALGERMAKLHAQSGQGILPARSRRALAAATREFGEMLTRVSARASTPEARESYALLGLLWRDYREWLAKSSTRETGRAIRERTEELVWVASKGARSMTDRARGAVSAAALRASSVALLSQRIPKIYLWRRWGMSDEALARELRESSENLGRALDALAAMPIESTEARAELRSAQTQQRFMAEATRSIDAGDKSARALEFVAKSGDNIFEAMERLVAYYLTTKE